MRVFTILHNWLNGFSRGPAKDKASAVPVLPVVLKWKKNKFKIIKLQAFPAITNRWHYVKRLSVV